jgi:hypothetical protein
MAGCDVVDIGQPFSHTARGKLEAESESLCDNVVVVNRTTLKTTATE